MIIPKTFKLFNQTIKVKLLKTLIDKEKAFGIWDYNKNIIYLQESTRKHKINKEQIESTFIHEAVHASLDLMGEHELSENEKFVHTFGNLLHQFIIETKEKENG